MILILKNINPVMIMVLLTFIIGLVNLNFKKYNHRLLLTILSVCMLTEMISLLLLCMHTTVSLLFSISIIIHHSLWLMALKKNMHLNGIHFYIIAFLAVSIIDFLFFEGFKMFNYYSFILGALIYITIFIYGSFNQLRVENFSFFQSNQYILLFSPVLFFFGLSFMFAFGSKEITSTIVFSNITLYKLVVTFVNIIYYALINLYIYTERKNKN